MSRLLLVTVAVSALLAGVAASTHAAARNGSVAISTRKIRGLGTVLVNSKGLTLYMFVPDKQRRVTCKAVCAAVWPPLKVAKGEKLVGLKGVKKALLGSDANPSGGRVATYAHWPLYTYVADTKPGQAKGQALDLNGGLWYVLAPSGKLIKTKAHG